MHSYGFIVCFVVIVVPSIYGYELEEIHNGSNISSSIGEPSGCKCSTYGCGCCAYVHVAEVKGTVCVNASYLPNDYGFSLTLTFNDYVLINETISATNPPPICVGLPELEKINAELCLVLYKLNWENHQFSGCAAIKLSVYHLIHKHVNLGCFRIPKSVHKVSHVNDIKRIGDVKKSTKDYEYDLKVMRTMPSVQII